MKKFKTERGFDIIVHPTYTDPINEARLVQESSAVGSYENSFEHPGCSFLWIGDKHHLNREEVTELVNYLKRWLKTGEL